jgi:rfaE bifunctional protein kinase chain/domain
VTPHAYQQLAHRFASLHVAVLGDFCLDRYLEIDPALEETSLETGLPAHNVVRVRSQPGGAGTVVNNLAALGVGRISLLGFCGDDGEGFELRRALAQHLGVVLEHFLTTDQRRTFTYAKPLVVWPGRVPQELNRLDIKNWTPTPGELEEAIIARLELMAPQLHALVVLDQVDQPNTGVVTSRVLEAVGRCALSRPDLLILADSRRGLSGYPPLGYKMNARELAAMQGLSGEPSLETVRDSALSLARSTSRPVFVTLAEQGIIGATPAGRVEHAPAHPTRGPIDIVGAGDAVTANLTAALAAGASLADALAIAMAAASIVIHQLGTTGTASAAQSAELLASKAS